MKKRVNIMLDEKYLNLVDDLASTFNISRSSMISIMITSFDLDAFSSKLSKEIIGILYEKK